MRSSGETIMKTVLFNAVFFTGKEVVKDKILIISENSIEGFAETGSIPEGSRLIDCRGWLVTSGFIDLQIAGGGGYLFSSNTTPEALARITESIVASGTTGFLLALPTNTPEVYREAFRTVRENPNPALMGLHLEGPFISLAKRGAHARELIRVPSEEAVRELLDEAGGAITMMTVAPEVCTAAVINLLKENGVTVAAGHSNASFRQASDGFAMGIETTTHLFNAMSPHTSP